jgi:hypothetical protein
VARDIRQQSRILATKGHCQALKLDKVLALRLEEPMTEDENTCFTQRAARLPEELRG